MANFVKNNSFMLKKTGSYYITHITVAATVAYAVTGNLAASLTLSLLEPTVQAVVYFLHERAWNKAAASSDDVSAGVAQNLRLQ